MKITFILNEFQIYIHRACPTCIIFNFSKKKILNNKKINLNNKTLSPLCHSFPLSFHLNVIKDKYKNIPIIYVKWTKKCVERQNVKLNKFSQQNHLCSIFQILTFIYGLFRSEFKWFIHFSFQFCKTIENYYLTNHWSNEVKLEIYSAFESIHLHDFANLKIYIFR